MKAFTVRELGRDTAAVLDAADREGGVKIKRRDGRVYALQPVPVSPRIGSLPDFAGRRRAIFRKAIPAAFVRQVDKLIAGE